MSSNPCHECFLWKLRGNNYDDRTPYGKEHIKCDRCHNLVCRRHVLKHNMRSNHGICTECYSIKKDSFVTRFLLSLPFFKIKNEPQVRVIIKTRRKK